MADGAIPPHESGQAVSGVLARGFTRLVTGPARYLIVLAWLGATIAAYRFLPGIPDEGGAVGILAPDNSVALRVEQRSYTLFGFPVLGRSAIIQRDPAGLSAAAQARVVDRAARLNFHQTPDAGQIAGALPIINSRALFPFAREDTTTAITYLFFPPDLSLYTRDGLAERFAHEAVGEPGDALVGVTGVVPVRTAEAKAINAALPKVELATVLLIAAIVGFTFRSFGAPVITLASAGIAYTLALRIVSLVGRRLGVAVPVELEPLLVVLILATCTDYAVFFLAGTRHRLIAGSGRIRAARTATLAYAPIILTAGVMVAACTACLLAARLGFLRDLGPALALSVLIALTVTMTLVPACLAIAGRLILWPGLHIATVDLAAAPRRESLHTRLIALTTKRSTAWIVAATCVTLLIAGSLGLGRLALGLSLVRDLPTSSEEAQAARAASLGFAPGIVSPTFILFEGPDIVRHQAALAQLEGMIERQPGVASVIGPREQPTGETYGAIFSRTDDAARLIVILADDPYEARAVATVRSLKNQLPTLLRAVGLPDMHAGIAGDTAVANETISGVRASVLPVTIAIALVVLILLALLLRSLVAPLYLLMASALAVATPLGLTVVLFQRLLGKQDVGFYVPVGIGVLLLALGSDYNIFIVGEIWEEARTSPLHEAINRAVPRATRAINIAALTLSASFALLAIVPLTTFRQFAFAMAVGVLIDSFLVRTYLVPSLITLVGKAGFWPRKV
jgi:RND superfamily putative drug exporter